MIHTKDYKALAKEYWKKEGYDKQPIVVIAEFMQRIEELERELDTSKQNESYAWKNTNEIEKHRQELQQRNAELVALCKEASDYLDTNNITSFGSTSILLKKFKALAAGE